MPQKVRIIDTTADIEFVNGSFPFGPWTPFRQVSNIARNCSRGRTMAMLHGPNDEQMIASLFALKIYPRFVSLTRDHEAFMASEAFTVRLDEKPTRIDAVPVRHELTGHLLELPGDCLVELSHDFYETFVRPVAV